MSAAPDPTLFRLSWPLFLQSLVMFAVMAADMAIWSAHGPDTVAALSVAGQMMRVVIELSGLLGAGALVMIARSLGRGDRAGAQATAEAACAASLLLGLCVGAALALLGPPALRLFALAPAVAADAAAYLRWSGAAAGLLFFGAAAVAALRAYGYSRAVLLLGLGAAAVYLALGWSLVLGAGPLPALGAEGAGIAGFAVRLLAAAALAAALARLLGLRLGAGALAGRLALARRMAGLAWPSVSDFIAYGFYQIVLLGFIAAQGAVEVLARAYAMIAVAFLTLVIMAVCQGGEVLVGRLLGRGDRAGARAQALRAAHAAAGLSTVCALALWLAADPFLSFFTDDAAVRDRAAALLLLTVLLQPCFAWNMVLFHALRAAEDARWPAAVSQALSWGLGLPLAWALCGPLGFGAAGVWAALIVEELAKSAVMLARWNALTRRAAA